MAAPDQRSDAKRRLLEKLLRGEASRQNQEAPLEPRAADTPIPLAPGQQLLWLAAQMAEGEPVYNEPFTLHYRGPLDREALERAFHEVIRRHEILRTTFAQVGSEIVQVIHDRMEIEIPNVDLSQRTVAEREREASRVADADARRMFDPRVGPLLRARLVTMEREYHRLYVTVHHVVIDGGSIHRILLQEIAAIYDAFAAGQSSPLPEVKYQYADFALWRKRVLDEAEAARQIDYWRAQLAGELPNLQLPSDRPPPAAHSYRGGMQAFAIPAGTVAALYTASRAEGASLYMFLLTGFKALLHRYSGQTDIIVGGVSEASRRAEFHQAMGMFVNFLALRTHPTAEMSFRDYLAQVKDTVLQGVTHCDVPFDRVLREVQPKRESSSRPFFQATLSIKPLRVEKSDPRWDLTLTDTCTGATKVDLYLEVDERPDGIQAKFIYSTALFDAATIERMIGHWLTLLEDAIRRPWAKLSELAILPVEEERQVRTAWNGAARELPPVTVDELIARQVERTPDAIAVEAQGVRLTYRELDDRANLLAHRLRAAGVNPGSLVALCVERTVDLVAAPLAVLKAGCAYLPLDPEFPKDRLAYLVEDAQAPALLTVRSLEGRLPASANVIYCDDPGGSTDGALEASSTPESTAYVLYTSGSTGRPKGVEIQHGALVNLLLSMQREPGFTASDSLLAVTTLSFDIAELELYLPLISGGRLVIASHDDARDPRRLMERLRESKCTVLQATPAAWRGMVDAGWQGQSDLRAFCGGEALPRDLAELLLPKVAELWNLYGPTETTVWSTVERVTSGSGPVLIGRPIDNTLTYVLDGERKLVPVGVAGELYIGGAGVARGYLRREELTAERFVANPFQTEGRIYRTGDLARWRADGRLECLGRIDNQVKIRGFRIEPGEIEAALLEHSEVRAAAVRVWPDTSGNFSIAAYVTGAPQDDLRRFLQQKLPDYMVPARIVFLDTLPLTPNGKVDRKALPEPSSLEPKTRRAAPRTEMERKLAAIWESVFNIRSIGVEDNFFDLGGHSFLVAKLLRKIEEEFGVRLSMAAVFEAPTISRLAELLRTGSPVARMPRVSTLQPAGSLEPLLWIYGGPLFRPLARSMGTQRPFLGVDLEHCDNEGLTDASFPEFAARLVQSIRAVQPHGPYYLGGWCISGLLAYEVAAQFLAAGEKVGLVVMLDAPNPKHYYQLPKFRVLRSKAAYHFKHLLRTEIRDVFSYGWERGRGFVRHLFDRRPPTKSAFEIALDAAALHYNPQPIAARVLAVQPQHRPAVWDLRESWAPHIQTGYLEVQDSPGSHLTMFEEPHVDALAACIRASLRDNVVEIRRVVAS